MGWQLLDVRQAVGDHSEHSLPSVQWMGATISVGSELHLTLDSQGQKCSFTAADTHLHGGKCLRHGQSRVTWAKRVVSFFRIQPPM